MRDSEIYGSVKPLRLIVVAITAPPLIAVFLSLWPVERNSLLLGCIMLLSISL